MTLLLDVESSRTKRSEIYFFYVQDNRQLENNQQIDKTFRRKEKPSTNESTPIADMSVSIAAYIFSVAELPILLIIVSRT